MRVHAFFVPGVVAALLAGALLVAPASAVVIPRTCGTVTHNGKRYIIRSHQLTCSKAKPWATRYLRTRRAPSGFRCTRYDPRETKIRFTCRRRDQDFLAIRK